MMRLIFYPLIITENMENIDFESKRLSFLVSKVTYRFSFFFYGPVSIFGWGSYSPIYFMEPFLMYIYFAAVD